MILHAPAPSHHLLPSIESRVEAEEMEDFSRNEDYDEIQCRLVLTKEEEDDFREEESSPHSSEEARSSANFRAELKRPDLKGSFRCSICGKVFCHSSSLSRHRMQAHFKSYKCTLCRKDITNASSSGGAVVPPGCFFVRSTLFSGRAKAAAGSELNSIVALSPSLYVAMQQEEQKKNKKPYKELTLQEKVQLIRLAEQNVGLSQAAIAERYSIAKSNVCRILQRKNEYLAAYESAGFAANRKRKLKPMEQPDSSEGNETLRTHMYKQHQISRMFMCRCCNWAFPDKTSLHMHIQAREEGKSISVPVIGKGLAPGDPLDRSAFAPVPAPLPLPPPHATLHAPAALPFFASAPPPPLSAPTPEELNRIRDRLMLNQLMVQQPFTLPWLNQLPKPIPTTRPLDVFPKEEEMEINVEKDDQSAKSDDEYKLNTSSDTDEPKSERSAKSSSSPCLNNSSSSTGSSSPRSSPLNLFKKNSNTPSAFHHLSVDSSRPNFITPHVSPADTHSSASPDGVPTCFDCAMNKTKLTMAENKCRYLESRANTLQTEAVRAQSSSTAAEAALRVVETEVRALRDLTEQLQRRLLDCQEQSLRFVQSDRTGNQQAVILFLNQLIQSSILR